MSRKMRWVLAIGFLVVAGIAVISWSYTLRASPGRQSGVDLERFAALKARVEELRRQGHEVSSLETIVADVEYWIAQGKDFEANLRIGDLESDLSDPKTWAAPPLPEVSLPPAPSFSPVPEAGSEVLLQEDFAGPDALEGWQSVFLAPDPGNMARWEVREKALYLNIGAGSMQVVGMASVVGEEWADCVYSADLYAVGNQEVGVVFRYGDAGFYRFRFLSWEHSVGPTRLLEWVEDGQATVLAAAEGPGYEHQRWYNVQVALRGPEIRVYLDGQPILEAEDARGLRGRVGVFALSLGDVYFDNIRVSAAR